MIFLIFFVCIKNPVDPANIPVISPLQGTVTGVSGKAAAGAVVTIVPAGYDYFADEPPALYTVAADNDGHFRFSYLPGGTYSIEITSESDGKLYIPEFRVNLSRPDTFAAVLEQTGAVTASPGFSFGSGYLYITGTTFIREVRDSGSITFDSLPAGTLPSLCFVPDTSLHDRSRISDSVRIEPRKTTVIPPESVYRYHINLVLNIAAAGDSISDTLTKIPLVLRLDKSNFDFQSVTDSGRSIRIVEFDGGELPYELQRWAPDSGKAEIWIGVDTVFGNRSTQTLQMYWGNPSVFTLSQASVVFDTLLGYAGVWHIERHDSVSGITDATAHHNDGVDSADAPVVPGVVGDAQQLDGVDDFLGFLQNGSLRVDKWTLLLWIKPVNAVNTFMIADWGNNESPYSDFTKGWALICNRDGAGALNFIGAGDTTFNVFLNTQFIPETWYHLAVTYDGATATIYLNGSRIGRTASSVSIAYNIEAMFKVGSRSMKPDSYLEGAVDEIQLLNYAIPENRIKLMYENQKTGSEVVKVK